MKKFVIRIYYFVLGNIVFLMICEITILFFFKNPSMIPDFLIERMRDIYKDSLMRIIQYEFSKYDNELTYILRHGKFTFKNFEFKTKYFINSLGLRDDEESLNKPDIIVVGDSFAMGWGVEQEETFAQIIEKRTKLKVLNAAISSYGTVREMKMLNRLDTSNLKYLVIQYCGNDVYENKYFFENGKLDITKKDSFEEILKVYKISMIYIPGKYTYLFLQKIFKEKFGKKMEDVVINNNDEVKWFLNAIIKNFNKNFEKVKIIVVPIGSSEIFSVFLSKEKMFLRYPKFINNIKVVRINNFEDGDVYILDGHLTNKGHKKVADKLIEALYN